MSSKGGAVDMIYSTPRAETGSTINPSPGCVPLSYPTTHRTVMSPEEVTLTVGANRSSLLDIALSGSRMVTASWYPIVTSSVTLSPSTWTLTWGRLVTWSSNDREVSHHLGRVREVLWDCENELATIISYLGLCVQEMSDNNLNSSDHVLSKWIIWPKFSSMST